MKDLGHILEILFFISSICALCGDNTHFSPVL
uniref:Uncharacterized protein n=2 Tax=unclassified Caudoviricetes TaxID=2788787 RepID=A0AAU8GCS8_9CAUD